MGRGGLQFMLIIWLQGIWLPQHGYSFSSTPLWAGIYMIPLTIGFLATGPVSGILSDRFGARPFATAGLVIAGAAFLLLELLPMDFTYVWFALLIFLFAVGSGMFFSPNQSGVMNSLPPDQRGAGAGMLATFQNSASVLSIGVFFTVITIGLAAKLPGTLFHGLVAQGVPTAAAHKVAALPPIGSLFAAFLGFNPIAELLGGKATLVSSFHLSPAHADYLLGRSFFPHLISSAFASGLHLAFDFAAVASFVAAVASLLRGGRYIHAETGSESLVAAAGEGLAGAAAAAGTEMGAGELVDELTAADD
jgi:MFS family permease